MTIQTNDHGRAGSQRSGLFARRARVAGLCALTGLGEEAVIDKHYATLPKSQRERLSPIYAAGEISSTDFPDSLGEGNSQLIATLGAASLLGRLPMAWTLPPNTQVNGFASEIPAASILGEGEAIPVSEQDFTRDFLSPITAKALLLVSQQLLEQPATDDALGIRLIRAAARAIDAEAIARCLNGAGPLAGGGATPAELRLRFIESMETLLDAGADERGIVFAVHPKTALRIAAFPGFMGSEFASVTALGGSLFGLPLIVTRGATAGTLTAIASDGIARSILPPQLDASKAASLEMSSVPGASAVPGETPAGQTQRVVSAFQTGMVALRVYAPFAIAFGRATRAVQIADVLPEIATA